MDTNGIFHIEEEAEFVSQRKQLSLIHVVHGFQESGDLLFVLLVYFHMPQPEALLTFIWSCGCCFLSCCHMIAAQVGQEFHQPFALHISVCV
jgi:hypothetical protein